MQLALKKPCDHLSVTLVQHFDDSVREADDVVLDGVGWFAAYQCDECGAITRNEVSADEVESAHFAPWLDEDSYQARTTEHFEAELDIISFRFMGRALR